MWVALLALYAASAPDPRKGEPLDGRAPASDPWRAPLAAPRLVLAAPRLLVRAALRPMVGTTAWVEERGLAERAHDLLTSRDGRVGLRPELRYESAFGLAAGARWFDRRTLGEGSLLEVRARAGPALMHGELRLRERRGLIGLFARYERNDRARFQDGLRYGADRGRVGVESEHRLGSRAVVRAVGDLRIGVFSPGDPIPGFVDSARLASAGAELDLDTRRGRYRTGVAVSAGGYGTRGFDGDPSRFVTLRAEARAWRGLLDRDLGVRLRARVIEPGGEVPFDELLTPSGPDGLRGIATGELRGHSDLVGSLEYRFTVVHTFEVMAFADAGAAFGERFTGFAWRRLESSFGAALRHDGALLQLAIAPDRGAQLLLAVGW